MHLDKKTSKHKGDVPQYTRKCVNKAAPGRRDQVWCADSRCFVFYWFKTDARIGTHPGACCTVGRCEPRRVGLGRETLFALLGTVLFIVRVKTPVLPGPPPRPRPQNSLAEMWLREGSGAAQLVQRMHDSMPVNPVSLTCARLARIRTRT
jgi:hypothetical protein